MSIKKVRNVNFKPFIEHEGFFDGPGLVEPPLTGAKMWYENLPISVRLFHHNTLVTARRHANFVNTE